MVQRYGLLPLWTSRKTCFLTSVYGHSVFYITFLVNLICLDGAFWMFFVVFEEAEIVDDD